MKAKRYILHPTENIILRERKEPKTVRTQYPVSFDTKIGRNQKVTESENGDLAVKYYPKKKIKQVFKNHI